MANLFVKEGRHVIEPEEDPMFPTKPPLGVTNKNPLGVIPKHPLGVTPKKIWLCDRLVQLSRALSDYYKVGLTPPKEWINEIVEIHEAYLKASGKLPNISNKYSNTEEH